MSALGQKQTFSNVPDMSALPPKADIVQHDGNVRFVPNADIALTSGGNPPGWNEASACGAWGGTRRGAARIGRRRFDLDSGLPLVCLYRDNRWHQLVPWIPYRPQENPLEVGRCNRLFL